jgi:CHAT domain/Tetratricopeptide repeat
MNRRDELLAGIRARLEKIGHTNELSAALEPAALSEANELADFLTDGDNDINTRYMLGWLHWYRFQSMRHELGEAESEAAITMFAPCFAAGIDGLPPRVMPVLAERTAPYAVVLLQNAVRSADPSLARAAVNAWKRITEYAAPYDARRAVYLSNLGIAFHLRFSNIGDTADLNAAVEAAKAAVACTGEDDPERLSFISNLGLFLKDRFKFTGNRADLDDAIEIMETVAGSDFDDHLARVRFASVMVTALLARFEQTGDTADLDKAIETGYAAADVIPPGNPDRPSHISNLLGSVLVTQFEHTGELRHLDALIDIRQEDLDACPPSSRGRAAGLSNIGVALHHRFELSARDSDLDKSIEAMRDAVEATPLGHPERAGLLSNLGNARRVRFEWTGTEADIDGSVEALQLAVTSTDQSHSHHARYLSNLSWALVVRFGRTGQLADLNAAIDAGRAALKATPAGHASYALRSSKLGHALFKRFKAATVRADLEAALALHREAVNITPGNHTNRASYLSNFGLALQAYSAVTGKLDDLDEAILIFKEAANSPRGFPDRALLMSNLAQALDERYGHTGDAADLSAATSAFIQVTEVVAAAPSMRIQAARVASSLLAQSEPFLAAQLLGEAVRLLPQAASRRLVRKDRQFAIGRFAGLASEAASLSLASDKIGTNTGRSAATALGLLEMGHGVLLGQALETRDDLTDLKLRNPQLAERFIILRERADRSTDFSDFDALDSPSSTTAPGRKTDRQQLLANEMAEVLAEIRAQDGFASFGLPPLPSELVAEAEDGPIVTFNISLYRSDALLLRTTGITSIELPGLAQATVLDKNRIYRAALAKLANGDRTAEETLTTILEWLWDAAAEPVMNALGYNQPIAEGETVPRIWWVTGGLLGMLPIHAAGYHAEPNRNGQAPRTILDRAISSYIPTIRALKYSRLRGRPATAPDRSLVVAMPNTLGGSSLPGAAAEAAQVLPFLPNPTLLIEAAATGEPSPANVGLPTRDNVLHELAQSAIVHLACHGISDPLDPSDSQLLLHDHATAPFSVASLAALDHNHLQLVYLSACRTAFSDPPELMGESIHMTSAFQLAGSRHVIGTLWEINDRIAVEIASGFYRNLNNGTSTLDTSQSSLALHQAVLDIRARYPQRPSAWSAYIHVGP